MFNVKDKYLRGHQVDYLNKEKRYMSPEYLRDVIGKIKPRYDEANDIDPVPNAKYDSSFGTGKISWNKKDLERHDMFTLGTSILSAGTLRSVDELYNDETFEIDQGILNYFIKEFEDRYDEKTIDPKQPTIKVKEGEEEKEVPNYKDSPLVHSLKQMLQLEPYNRPTFQTIKDQIAPDMTVRDKTNIAWREEEDPFKDQEDWRRQQLEEEENNLTQKQLEALALKRLAEDPVHGGVFGKHNEFRGRRDFNSHGYGHTELAQGKLLGSLDQVNARNRALVNDSHNFHPDIYNRGADAGDVQAGNFNRSNVDGVINRRYFV